MNKHIIIPHHSLIFQKSKQKFNQIQCQLQMSVQKMQRKQQNYNDFNHFLYQIIRGKFGVLSECATIIAQHDPIVAADGSNNSVFKPKQKEKKLKKEIKNQKNQLFICCKCNQLKQSKSQFLKLQKSQQYKCDQCRIKQAQDKQSLLKDEKLKAVITKLKQGKQMYFESVEGKTYKQLKQFIICKKNQRQCNNPSLLISVMAGSSQLNFELVGYLQYQSILYASTLYPRKLNQDKLIITNLTPLIQKKQKKLPNFTYFMNGFHNIDQVMANNNFKDIQQFKKKIQNQIMEETAISRVKNKKQNLVFKNQQQLEKFEEIISDPTKGNLGSIEFILSQKLQMPELPKWIDKCSKLKILDVRYNKITDISILKECDQITELYLSGNPIKIINFDEFKSSWQNLTILMLSGNFQELQFCQLPNLINLDIIQCYQLKKILLKEFPQLQTLNISKNTSLTILELKAWPKLQTLDIIQNSKLPDLLLNEWPQLQTLAISKNTQLNSLKLKEWPKLQTLDIIQNSKLPDLLLNEWPQLQTLAISKNTQLSSLKLKEWPQLRTLNIPNNISLSSLQLKEWSQLRTLNIPNNTQLTSLQLNELARLQILNIYENSKLISIQLKELVQLQTLTIFNNTSLISLQLKDLPQLQALTIVGNDQLPYIVIPNLLQILVLTLSCNPHLLQLKIESLPKLLKISLDQLPKLLVDKIDWNLNDGVNFCGDDEIWKSIKLKQPKLKAKRIKQWNDEWYNLKQLQKQGPMNKSGQYINNISQIME